MNKNIFKTVGLSLLLLLSSCGGNTNINGTLYLGDGFTKKDAVLLNYNLNSVLDASSRINGYIKTQENTIINSSYSLAYTSNSPFSSNNYSETIICTRHKDIIEQLPQKEINYDISLDITKIFKNTEEESTVYFVFHMDNWENNDLTTYTYTSFRYVWNNDTVKLLLD